MSLVKKPEITPRKQAANRANGRKSRGPVTTERRERVKFNALQYGLYSAPFQANMRRLGENPFEYEQLHQDLIDEWQPSTMTQRMLVRRLCCLLWRQMRSERGHDGVIARRIEEELGERFRREQEETRAVSLRSQFRDPGAGLRLAQDSVSKFSHLLSHLDALLYWLDHRNFAETVWETALRMIYGKEPTARGEEILRLYHEVRKSESLLSMPEARPETEGAAAQDEDPSADAADTAALHRAESSAGSGREAETEAEEYLQSLREALLRELEDVRVEATAYRREYVEISPALRNSLLVPEDKRWNPALRADSLYARQIQQNIGLLIKLKSRRRRDADDAQAEDQTQKSRK